MGQVQIGIDAQGVPIIVQYDDTFSHKDFTGWYWQDRNIPNNIVIYGSCFSHETPDAKIFKSDMTGVTFVNCNLDNVSVPAGNTVVGSSTRRFKAENDLRNWSVDQNNQPIKLINEKNWANLGYSISVLDIPAQPIQNISELPIKVIAVPDEPAIPEVQI